MDAWNAKNDLWDPLTGFTSFPTFLDQLVSKHLQARVVPFIVIVNTIGVLLVVDSFIVVVEKLAWPGSCLIVNSNIIVVTIVMNINRHLSRNFQNPNMVNFPTSLKNSVLKTKCSH